MQVRLGKTLQHIINAEGLDRFCRLEEQCILDLDLRGHVIATGGSAVRSEKAMEHLRRGGPVVYLSLPIDVLVERVDNLAVRGRRHVAGTDAARRVREAAGHV